MFHVSSMKEYRLPLIRTQRHIRNIPQNDIAYFYPRIFDQLFASLPVLRIH